MMVIGLTLFEYRDGRQADGEDSSCTITITIITFMIMRRTQSPTRHEGIKFSHRGESYLPLGHSAQSGAYSTLHFAFCILHVG